MSNENKGNSISAIFGNLFNRKEENKEPNAQERAQKLVESYKLDPLMEATVVTKLANLEQQAEDQKSDAEKVVENSLKAVEAEEEKALKAKGVKDAAKAVALRARTLGTEVKKAKEFAEKAKTEAEEKIKDLKKQTDVATEEGNALIAGLTDVRFDLESAASLTDEEFNLMFGLSGEEPKKAPDLKGGV